jgi:hypothetical protein
MVLSVNQKKLLLHGLSHAKKMACKEICRRCTQNGEGLGMITRRLKRVLGPLIRTVGPKVLKAFLIQQGYISASGSGRCCKGKGIGPIRGGTLKLPGTGSKRLSKRKKTMYY